MGLHRPRVRRVGTRRGDAAADLPGRVVGAGALRRSARARRAALEEALTAPQSTPPPSLSGVPMSSVIGRIEKELRDMWTAPAKPGELPKSRVCTMNLIVVAGSRRMADKYIPIV